MKGVKPLPIMVLAASALLRAGIPEGLQGQEQQSPWRLEVGVALLNPRVKLDRWFVTEEGYHVHPASEDLTPGVQLGLAFRTSPRIEAELDVLLGGAPVFVGIVDQFSTREPSARGRMGFLLVLASPNLLLPLGERSTLILGPTGGVGWTNKTSVRAALGPAVTFGGGFKWVFGAKAGLETRLGEGPLSLSASVMALSMTLSLREDTSGLETSKPFGPMGLLLGGSFPLR